MAAERLRKLTAFVIDKVREESGSLPKTKLVKLLYLIDVNAVRRLGRPITGIEWRYWHYGPYSPEIESAIGNVLGREANELEIITKDGRRILTYEPVEPQAIEQEFGLEERLVVYGTLKTWAVEELRSILNFVYFETEPMLEAEWGRRLDLSTVRREQDERKWDLRALVSRVPQDRLAVFRAALRKQAERLKLQAASTEVTGTSATLSARERLLP